MRPRILLVEDDAERGREMAAVFGERFDCRHVGSVEAALAALMLSPWAAVVVDYDLAEGGSGLEVLQVVRETSPRTFRLFYAGSGTASLVRDVTRLVQPHALVDARRDDFIAELRRSLRDLLEPAPFEPLAPARSILADSHWTAHAPVTQEFLRQLRAAAEQETPVYLYGEPGTGKTRAAGILRHWRQEWKAHHPTGRARGPLPVPVIRVPALRERPQDLPELAARVLVDTAHATGDPPRRLTARALEELMTREWRGNVVELGGVLARAAQRVGTRAAIDLDDLPRDAHPAWRPSQYAKDEGQRDCVLRQLRTARNVSAAARLEGCSRANYIRLMRRLGIIRADVAMEHVPGAAAGAPERE